jgi:bifunctional UDP-N-acetylglucosamine pyrophosphorylase/glucosamine-1-phosphate N-acetyltransferase
MEVKENSELFIQADTLSSEFNYASAEAAIILAAGHGKRIKSQRSKMLHKIWGVSTVERVYNACKDANPEMNTIIVVGIKANDVMKVIGKRESTLFAYQQYQNGTGHAVQVGLEKIDPASYDGAVYVFPGDMGLIDKETILKFKSDFQNCNCDMMVLTGLYEGDPANNSYGRIIRVKGKDAEGRPSGADEGKVIEIMEHKDILALSGDKPYRVKYNGRDYEYSRQELIENNEFNSSVYAFKYKKLIELINNISSNNAQNEIYITDLIALFNQKGYGVQAASPAEQYVIMGFNNKSVLKEMDEIARKKVYEKLKDIIEIDDPEDFFIHDSVVNNILEADKKGIPLDVVIGKGVYIGKGANLNYNLHLHKNVFIKGPVVFGKNVNVLQNVHLSAFNHQILKIGNNVEINSGDIIKGNLEIGDNSRIESSVNMTGNDEFPTRIGKNVLIKGTSYIFGSIIEDDVHIEHSIIIKKRVEKIIKRSGEIQKIRFILPTPEGIDALEDL